MGQSNISNYWELQQSDLDGVDRLLVDGRRGTGKSTGVKLWIASGKPVIWLQRTKELTALTYKNFVPPAVRDILPAPELVAGGAYPLFRFGDGIVQAYPIRLADQLKQTGVAVGDYQAEAVILDEYILRDGRYLRGEPEALDSFAGTAGRTGVMPPVICLGNPLEGGSNASPYAHSWRTNLDAVGVYEDRQGRLSRVVSTADCRDCYGKIVGIDATEARYCPTLTTGGFCARVDDVTLRIRFIGRGAAVCRADDDGRAPVWYARGHWMYGAIGPSGARTLYRLGQMSAEGRVVFDGYVAEAAFYVLIKRF